MLRHKARDQRDRQFPTRNLSAGFLLAAAPRRDGRRAKPTSKTVMVLAVIRACLLRFIAGFIMANWKPSDENPVGHRGSYARSSYTGHSADMESVISERSSF